MNLLIVEDDPHVTRLLLSCVQEADSSIRTFTTSHSAEALSIAGRECMDLFILDIQLADYKGTTLASQLRAMEQYSYTPMIFATAMADEELTAYRELKCYSFLIKPFTKEEVVQVLRDTLRYHQHLMPREQKQTLQIEQKSHIHEYELRRIMYVESFGKTLELHLMTADNQITAERISGWSLKKMAVLLEGSSFVQCHKSYLINCSYITHIDKTAGLVELSGAASPLPIGNKYRDNLLNRATL
ncbi:LytR/AlgR family response regulator transcription factor [Paenibacillus donghaensis]|uniref:DNA-binding response regulator n=1 Tax=Paenibacillus donghaensis TaxID=414771 RepID=A0A2Z2KN04_9BACL|nr:LytTR family DNA-binding domain-containing protein [Paenibacillus donghaensis]ASA23969.1 hypothetical protein B9T62_26215 [Paenibacillus donghaensis]